MRMRHAAIAALSLGLVAGAAGAAEARDGCGLGFHRGIYGLCRPNFGPRPFADGYGPGFAHRWHRVGWYGGPRFHRWGWHGAGLRHAGWHAGWHRPGGWHRRW
jgi:hypothetical protein